MKVLKGVSTEQGQLSRLWASSEVRTPNPQVARVDSRLPIAGAPPPARVFGAVLECWKHYCLCLIEEWHVGSFLS